MGKRWTEEQVKYLYDHWEKETLANMAEHLKRNELSVRSKAFHLGFDLSYYSKTNHWSSDEVIYLKENLAKKSLLLIAKDLGRSEGAVKAKALRLKYNPSVYDKTYCKNCGKEFDKNTRVHLFCCQKCYQEYKNGIRRKESFAKENREFTDSTITLVASAVVNKQSLDTVIEMGKWDREVFRKQLILHRVEINKRIRLVSNQKKRRSLREA